MMLLMMMMMRMMRMMMMMMMMMVMMKNLCDTLHILPLQQFVGFYLAAVSVLALLYFSFFLVRRQHFSKDYLAALLYFTTI